MHLLLDSVIICAFLCQSCEAWKEVGNIFEKSGFQNKEVYVNVVG